MASDSMEETEQEMNYYIVKENIERNIYEVVGRYNSDLEQALQHLRLFGSKGGNDKDRLESDTTSKRLSYIGRAIIPVANMKALHPFSLQRTPIKYHFRSDPINEALECCYWSNEDEMNHMMHIAEKEHQIIMSARKISSTTESQSNIVYDREAFYNFSKQFAKSLEQQEDSNTDYEHQPKRRRSSLLNRLSGELQNKILLEEEANSSSSAGEKRSAEQCRTSRAKNEKHITKHTTSRNDNQEEENTLSPSKVFIENMDEIGKNLDGKGDGC